MAWKSLLPGGRPTLRGNLNMQSLLDCENPPRCRRGSRGMWKASGKETKVAEPINSLSCLGQVETQSCNYFSSGRLAFLEILRNDLGAALGICANKKRNTILFFSDLNSPRWICEQLINGRIILLITEGKQVYLWGLFSVN